MSKMPSIEVLEAHHDFPCEYTIKAIGSADDDFIGRVVVAVQTGIDSDTPPDYTLKETSGGKHVSLTFEWCAASAEQVIEVYKEINVVDGLIMVL